MLLQGPACKRCWYKGPLSSLAVRDALYLGTPRKWLTALSVVHFLSISLRVYITLDHGLFMTPNPSRLQFEESIIATAHRGTISHHPGRSC